MRIIKKKIRRKIEGLFQVEKLVKAELDNRMTIENFSSIETYGENDIFLASYPKSGVTWMQNLVTGMLFDSISQNITPKLVGEIIPDVHSKRYYKRVFPRMFFKTHNLPRPEYKKVIHLVRDGRDSIVSFYHYLRLNKSSGPTFSQIVDMRKDIWPHKWHEHTKAWHDNPYNAKVLTVRYEDLKENPIETLKRISIFSDIHISEKKLMEVYETNNIKSLRRKVEKYGWDYDKSFGKDSKKFFRKGISGDYKNELSPELIRKFEKDSHEMLLKYGYEI